MTGGPGRLRSIVPMRGWWADAIMRSIQQTILEVERKRAEQSA